MWWEHQISALAATLVAINVKWAVMGNKIKVVMLMIVDINTTHCYDMTPKIV